MGRLKQRYIVICSEVSPQSHISDAQGNMIKTQQMCFHETFITLSYRFAFKPSSAWDFVLFTQMIVMKSFTDCQNTYVCS